MVTGFYAKRPRLFQFSVKKFTSKPFCAALSEREIFRSICNCKGQKWQGGCSFHRGLESNCWCLALLLFFLLFFLFFFFLFLSLFFFQFVCICTCGCNRVHLQIVFALLYSLCRFVSVLLCMDVIQSFTFVLLCWTSLRERNRKQEAIPTASRRQHHQKKKKIRNKTNRNFWLWFVCCSLLPT